MVLAREIILNSILFWVHVKIYWSLRPGPICQDVNVWDYGIRCQNFKGEADRTTARECCNFGVSDEVSIIVLQKAMVVLTYSLILPLRICPTMMIGIRCESVMSSSPLSEMLASIIAALRVSLTVLPFPTLVLPP